jgi:ABC-2 type transport system ATP-binding protein
MPDSFGVYEGLTTLEYLQFFADLFKLPKATRKETIDDVVQLLNLEPKLGTPVEGLSRGQRQRLSLARTLLHNPQVLILDEPASGLDPLARMEFLYILRELRNLGKTLLISSHILSEVSEICDLLMIMTEGEVVAFGSMEEICQRVRPHYAIELELLEDQTQAAIDYLKTQGVTEFNATDRLLEFDFVGEREELMEIHRGLVMNNIPLLYFRPLELTLEQAFAELTTMPAKQATSAISSVHPVMDEVYEAFTDDSVEKEAQESGDTSNVDEESYKLATGGFTAPRA